MKKLMCLTAAAGFIMSAGVAVADQNLATAKGCMGCHAIDKKVLGPSYRDVAKKYAGDKTAEAKLAEKVKKGGSGVWGPIPMPANNVSDAEATQLVHWVLSLK
ncbi:MAG: c-type cytochrome [Sulfuricellaceae bacterium]|nr:c-type cytochrome [Sulfuricellaceae bacterium]